MTNTYNTEGAGGFSFGTNINQYNQSVPSPDGKSTEHNIAGLLSAFGMGHFGP